MLWERFALPLDVPPFFIASLTFARRACSAGPSPERSTVAIVAAAPKARIFKLMCGAMNPNPLSSGGK